MYTGEVTARYWHVTPLHAMQGTVNKNNRKLVAGKCVSQFVLVQIVVEVHDRVDVCSLRCVSATGCKALH